MKWGSKNKSKNKKNYKISFALQNRWIVLAESMLVVRDDGRGIIKRASLAFTPMNNEDSARGLAP